MSNRRAPESEREKTEAEKELKREWCTCLTAAHRRESEKTETERKRARARGKGVGVGVCPPRVDAARRVRRQDDRARPPRRHRLRAAGLVAFLHLTA